MKLLIHTFFSRILITIAFSLLIPSLQGSGNSPLISDNMIIQREKGIHLWGTADSDEAVTVLFQGKNMQQ